MRIGATNQLVHCIWKGAQIKKISYFIKKSILLIIKITMLQFLNLDQGMFVEFKMNDSDSLKCVKSHNQVNI